MRAPPFFSGLVVTSLLTTVLVGAEAYVWPSLQTQVAFLVLCVLVFAGFCLLMYYSARQAANSPNPARLAQYVMVLTFVKMAVSIGLVYGYYLTVKPEGQAFLLPFFTAYFVFTVFETWWLLRLNRLSSKRQR